MSSSVNTPRICAKAGRRGLVVPFNEFRARLGGEEALRKILNALSVAEIPQRGRPKNAPRAVRRAYDLDRRANELVLPRVKGAPFLRARTAAGLPLIDAIVAGDDALPAPRQIAAERCLISEDAPLWPYQEAIVDHFCGNTGPLGAPAQARHQGVAYLQLDPGLGKTRIGCAIVARLRTPALIVSPTDAIANQWWDEFAEVFPDMRVARYANVPAGGRRKELRPGDHDALLIVINTAREKPAEFFEGFGIVILDEAHEYQSPVNGKILWLAQTRAVLGLSGTPTGRPDGLDRYVHLHLGAPILPATIPGFDAGAVNFTAEVRAVAWGGDPDYCDSVISAAGTMVTVSTIGRIVQDPARLRMVADEVERLYRLHETADDPAALGLGPRPAAVASDKFPAGEVRRHGVFVFAELRDYLPAIRAALKDRLGAATPIIAPEIADPEDADPEFDAPPIATPPPTAPVVSGVVPKAGTISILRGGVQKAAVDNARKAGAHIVLTTYGFSRRGISLPEMTAMVLATPRRNGSLQILGRIFRRGSDESIVRQIVDVVDVRTGLKGQYSDRKKVYDDKNFPITRVAMSWEAYATTDATPIDPVCDRGVTTPIPATAPISVIAPILTTPIVAPTVNVAAGATELLPKPAALDVTKVNVPLEEKLTDRATTYSAMSNDELLRLLCT